MPADYLTPRSPRSAAPAWPGTSAARLRCVLVRVDGAERSAAQRFDGVAFDASAPRDDAEALVAWVEAQRTARQGGAVGVEASERAIQTACLRWLGGDASRPGCLRIDAGHAAVVDLDENGAALRALNVERP